MVILNILIGIENVLEEIYKAYSSIESIYESNVDG